MTRTGRFYAEIYGCSMNRGEAELFLSRLEDDGLRSTDDPGSADVSFIFTCTVIGQTERRMLNAVRSLPAPLVVSGCMASAQADRVRESRPDAFMFTPENHDGMLLFVRDLVDAGHAPDDEPPAVETRRARDIRRYPFQDSAAIVPIATGCAGHCSYCITRLARPNLVSRPVDEVVQLVATHAGSGSAEVRLSAQDAAVYGRDLDTDLPSLIAAVTDGPGPMLRVGMMNADTVIPILDEIIDSYRSDRVFRFLHLPLQSGSDRVLEAMGRKYTVEEHASVISRFREAFPGMTISTDVIVGYPGEEDADHEATVRAVEALGPSILNVTRFSPRPGTPAADLEPVRGSVAKERTREISSLHREASQAANGQRIGAELHVIVTEPGREGSVMARDQNYVPVVIEGAHEIGTRLDVEIVDATEAYLVGVPL